MSEVHDVTPVVSLRSVEDRDLDVFFDHQADPQAVEMAAFPARDKDQFAVHWAKLRADDTKIVRTIVADGVVAGNIGSWQDSGQQLLGYWIGRECWGRGVATQALARFVDEVSIRPLYAQSRCTTWARSASWTSAASGAITSRRRRSLRPTTA
jgi:RimJ/RimL family protein N-acetyltransferase